MSRILLWFKNFYISQLMLASEKKEKSINTCGCVHAEYHVKKKLHNWVFFSKGKKFYTLMNFLV